MYVEHGKGEHDRGLLLVFRGLSAGDSGKYACEAEIDGRLERKDFEIKVIEPIAFDYDNEVQSVEEGTAEFLLLCDVSGDPRPEVSWNVRGRVVVAGETEEDEDKYEVTEGGLLIRNVTQADRGSYKCKATQMEEYITDFKELVITLKVQRTCRTTSCEGRTIGPLFFPFRSTF